MPFKLDITYQVTCNYLQDVYDREFVTRIHKLPSATLPEILAGSSSHAEVKLQYLNRKEFESFAKKLKVMSDLRVSNDTVIYMYRAYCSSYIHRVVYLGLPTGGLLVLCIEVNAYIWFHQRNGQVMVQIREITVNQLMNMSCCLNSLKPCLSTVQHTYL